DDQQRSALVYFGRFDRNHRLSFYAGLSHYFVSLSDAHNFFDRCSALGHAPPAVLPQSFHAFGNSALLQLAAITPSHDQLSQRLGDNANFVNRCATLVTSLATLIATGAAPQQSAAFFHRETPSAVVI